MRRAHRPLPRRWPAGTHPCRRCTSALPGVRHPSANRADCWSTTRPATGTRAPKALVVPTTSSQRRPGGAGARRPGRTRPAARAAPVDRVEVEHQGAAGGGHVGDELAGQWVHEPGVRRGDDALAGDGVAQPAHLRCGEVGIDDQPGALRHEVVLVGQRVARRTANDCPARRSRSTADDRWPGPTPGTVSPWLARATASIGTPAAATACRPASSTEASSSCGSCSTPPPARYAGCTGTSTSGSQAAVVMDDDRLRA